MLNAYMLGQEHAESGRRDRPELLDTPEQQDAYRMGFAFGLAMFAWDLAGRQQPEPVCTWGMGYSEALLQQGNHAAIVRRLWGPDDARLYGRGFHAGRRERERQGGAVVNAK